MLTKFDDYPIHQTPEPVARPATADRNAYDRYWFNGYAEDGEFYFGVGLGLYPNLRIMDCGFSIVRDGEQHAFHGSRRAPSEPTETTVGPFRLEVVEPMRSIRLIIEPNETGIECDLLFRARTACIEEGRQTWSQNGRVALDNTRFAQFGRWEGSIRYDGREVIVDPARVFGTKDRSWGLRPVGDPDPGGAPATELPQFYFLWAPINWKDRCTHFGVFENDDGRPWHWDAAIVPAYEDPNLIPGVEENKLADIVEVGHQLSYIPGTRRAGGAEVYLVEANGARHDIKLEPLICFRMKGIGYTHPEWGHGCWKGELAIAAESWKCDDLDPMAVENQHIQQVMRATCNGETGVGVMEQLAIGPHARYGFKDFLDPA